MGKYRVWLTIDETESEDNAYEKMWELVPNSGSWGSEIEVLDEDS